MTGFGRAEMPLSPEGRAVVEVRCLNSRFLEIDVRLADGFQPLEGEVRAAIGKKIRRGQVRVTVSAKVSSRPAAVALRADVARRYAAELKKLKKELSLPGTVTLEAVLALPQVVAVAEREGPSRREWKQVQTGLLRALGHAAAMRRKEGERTAKVLERILRSIETLRGRVVRRLPEVERQMKERFLARLEKAMAQAPPPQKPVERPLLLAEASAFAQGGDVSEELARIASHLEALRKAESGRTIDFLAQELQREVNTLGTKQRDSQVTRWVVAMKGQVEKLREQAANIE